MSDSLFGAVSEEAGFRSREDREDLRSRIDTIRSSVGQAFRHFTARQWASVEEKIRSGPLRKSSVGDLVELRFLAIELERDIVLLDHKEHAYVFSKEYPGKYPHAIIRHWYSMLTTNKACSMWEEKANPTITIKFILFDHSYARVTTPDKVRICSNVYQADSIYNCLSS